MKKLTLLIALAFIIQATTISQSCLPQGITFRIQAQIDDFQINYPNCTEIEGDVQIGEWGGGSDISNLNALNVLTSIGGSLSIEYNSELSSLSGLSSLTYIGGSLIIKYNGLIYLTGLNNVDSVGNDIRIYGNDSLSSLTGLEGITAVKGDLTADNPSLVSLSGLENITFIGGLFTIGQNALSSLTGVENLDSIGGTLWIYGNELTTLSGLDNVTSIGGDIIIDESDLASIAALENLTSIEGGFYIGGPWGSSIHLTSLIGLENVVSIGGDLRIMNLDSLTSLTGLDNVTSIGGNLQIWDNDALVTFSGLDNLDSIEGNLEIGWLYYWPRGNPSLNSLENLGNLSFIGGDVIIIYNDTLSSCEAQSICEYLANPNGGISIYNNAPGCNSPEEVEMACAVGMDEPGTSEKLIIHPNPFSTSTSIEFNSTQPGKVELKIYNQLGELIEVIQKHTQAGKQTFTWDASYLPSGIYFIRMQIGNELITRKMIKLN